MIRHRQPKPTFPQRTTPPETTLAHVLTALENSAHSETRRRDLRSGVKRVAALLGEEPSLIPLDLSAISAKLAAVNPLAAGLTPKSLANIRSDFLAAVRARGLKTGEQKSKAPLSPAWSELMGRLSSKRLHIGLSRLARFASANETKPSEIDDTAIEKFIAAVREGSLHRKPDSLHRSVALIWNEVGKQTGLNLLPVRVPPFVDWPSGQSGRTTTVVSAETIEHPVGTRVEISFGPALPCGDGVLYWAKVAHHFAAFGSLYSGKSSPWW